MRKILVADSSERDAESFRRLLTIEGLEVHAYTCGSDAQKAITSRADDYVAAIILWEIPGPPFGFELLARCRQTWPSMPVVVVTGTLDAALATRAYALGAKYFLEKPLESEEILSRLRPLLTEQDTLSPLVVELGERIMGQSSALLAVMKQTARIIPHVNSCVLLIGEPGTGKELFAKAIHQLGPNSKQPWVDVNIGAIPSTLIESELFGHEKGAFTGATERRIGFFEKAGTGTLFLDEIGDLELSLQVKLLRVIQEKEFRRLGANNPLRFNARLVCATNRDLAVAVKEGAFRRDLFDRIAETTIRVPPLRAREGDADLLLKHFLRLYSRKLAQSYSRDFATGFARETLTILRSYSFPGNIRELENLVKAALLDSDGDLILPHHLPLASMGIFLAPQPEAVSKLEPNSQPDKQPDPLDAELLDEVARSLPDKWISLPYREVAQSFIQAFDRIYLQRKLEQCRNNVTKAALEANIDTKTFRKRWKESGLPDLRSGEDDADA